MQGFLERRSTRKNRKGNATGDGMSPEESINAVRDELGTGIALLKCQKCGCMENGLATLGEGLIAVGTEKASALAKDVAAWRGTMRPIQYSCLGCDHCYPAAAQNALAESFPSFRQTEGLSCEFRVKEETWPPAVGEYIVLDPDERVAVSTLASGGLAEELAQRKPLGLAIVGKTETENIGIDKIVKNVVTNSALRYLIVAGVEAKGHQPGKTLVALATNGVDNAGRVIGSPGKRPILRNVTEDEVQAFRQQVQVIDMVGCESPDEIGARIESLPQVPIRACACNDCGAPPVTISTVCKIVAAPPTEAVTMDRAGYFVILPLAQRGIITVEHYGYDNTVLRTIEGADARAIYMTIIKEGWVTELSHAAYVGKELTRAELSLQYGFRYIQDGA